MVALASPRLAATVALVREGLNGPEVLLTKRPSTMAFAPDVHVFPGGALDEGDRDPDLLARSALSAEEAAARLGGDVSGDEAVALHMAAIRELFEEAGVLLAEAIGGWPLSADLEAARAGLLGGQRTFADVCSGLNLRPLADRLAPLSRGLPPRVVPRRFDAWFFAAELPSGVEPSFAPSEVIDHRWMTPTAALAARAEGAIDLWVPTSATLQQLEHAGSFDAIEARLAPGPSGATRLVEELPGLIRLALPAAGGVPGQPVNGYVVGRRELVIVDPGDPTPEILERVETLAKERGALVGGVAITHADPDHHAGAEAIAMTLDVPIFTGPGAAAALPYDVAELADGAKLPAGDVEMRVLATPGHRSDHVAYVADGFVLAGDLVGPGPARSIVGPPDRAAWEASLDRLEALGPSRLFPGHGDPLASVREPPQS